MKPETLAHAKEIQGDGNLAYFFDIIRDPITHELKRGDGVMGIIRGAIMASAHCAVNEERAQVASDLRVQQEERYGKAKRMAITGLVGVVAIPGARHVASESWYKTVDICWGGALVLTAAATISAVKAWREKQRLERVERHYQDRVVVDNGNFEVLNNHINACGVDKLKCDELVHGS